MSPIILVGGGILVLGLGLGLGYWFAHNQYKREATRTNDVRKELDNYRQHVTEHFGETAQHFQALGQQYQSLYKHMAQGADSLCDPAQSDTLLGFAAGNAPAIMASDGQGESPPEVAKDYVTVEENEPPQVEPDVETATPSDLSEDSSVPDVTTAKLSVEEAMVDQVAAPPPEEKKRTMH
jgi:uncharacterized membrane-anchored protein YhcB (DUF1043 family)